MTSTIVGIKCQTSVKAPAVSSFINAFSLAVVILFALLATPTLHGQATGSFSGTVVDQTGAVIPGAR